MCLSVYFECGSFHYKCGSFINVKSAHTQMCLSSTQSQLNSVLDDSNFALRHRLSAVHQPRSGRGGGEQTEQIMIINHPAAIISRSVTSIYRALKHFHPKIRQHAMQSSLVDNCYCQVDGCQHVSSWQPCVANAFPIHPRIQTLLHHRHQHGAATLVIICQVSPTQHK